VDGNTADNIYAINQVLDFIERDCLDIESDAEEMHQFCCISTHQGRLLSSDGGFKGSNYNFLVELESWEFIRLGYHCKR
jgi:hypothetical protein